MMKPLKKVKLIINHLLVAFDVFLENDLHCHFSSRSIGFPNNSIGTSTLFLR